MTHHCKCGAELIFRRHHETGRSAPIEPVPSVRGNIRILPDGRYEVLTGDRLREATGPLYLNHYVTCAERRSHQ